MVKRDFSNGIMEKAFENVGLILCHPKHEHRRTLRTALVAEGSKHKRCQRTEVIRDIMEKPAPGLTVIDLDMPDGSTVNSCDFLQQESGINPFIPIIAVTWDANMDVVKEAVDAGVMTYLRTNFAKSILGRTDVSFTIESRFS